MSVPEFLNLFVTLAAIALLLFVAWRDALTFRIANTSVLALLALAAIALVLEGGADLWPRLATAGLLFALGVVFWALGMMGAGDAKLFLPVGLLLDWTQLWAFALVLLGLSLAAAGLMALPLERYAGRAGPVGRLAAIKQTGEFPFGVPIALAAIAAIVS